MSYDRFAEVVRFHREALQAIADEIAGSEWPDLGPSRLEPFSPPALPAMPTLAEEARLWGIELEPEE